MSRLFRSVVSGECKMGLELFLTDDETRVITRSFGEYRLCSLIVSGSTPWLFPIGTDFYCNVKDKNSSDYKPKNIKNLLLESGAAVI